MKKNSDLTYKPSLTTKGVFILLFYTIGMFLFVYWFMRYPMWMWRLTQYNLWDYPWNLPPVPVWMTIIQYGWFVVLTCGYGLIIWRYADREAM